MKKFSLSFWVVVAFGTSGCFGWGDYMKFSPGPSSREIWFKQGISETQFKADRDVCRGQVDALPPPVAGDYSYADKAHHMIENCMLEKGYTFKDAIPANGGKRYCKTYHGGPACKSIGQ